MSRRLFIALPVDETVRASLEFPLAFFNTHKKILKPASGGFHITLKFFGGLDEIRARNLEEDFPHLILPGKALPYTVRGLGAFPNPARPNVLWAVLEFSSSPEPVFAAIESFALEHGFEKEKRGFHPHLTLARVKRDKRAPDELVDFIRSNRDTLYAESCFTSVVLFESTLTQTGPIYTRLRTINFQE